MVDVIVHLCVCFGPDLKGGGYDNIIWFSDSPKIAQLYIPKAGSKLFISPDSIARPSKDNDIQMLQKELGIEYDYLDVKCPCLSEMTGILSETCL